MDLLPDIDTRRLLKPQIVIAPLDINNVFFLDQIGNCSLDLLDVVASRIDANDLLFGWTEPLELFENVNQRNSLDDLASESTFRKLVEDGTR